MFGDIRVAHMMVKIKCVTSPRYKEPLSAAVIVLDTVSSMRQCIRSNAITTQFTECQTPSNTDCLINQDNQIRERATKEDRQIDSLIDR